MRTTKHATVFRLSSEITEIVQANKYFSIVWVDTFKGVTNQNFRRVEMFHLSTWCHPVIGIYFVNKETNIASFQMVCAKKKLFPLKGYLIFRFSFHFTEFIKIQFYWHNAIDECYHLSILFVMFAEIDANANQWVIYLW